jgi:hypothetical protein
MTTEKCVPSKKYLSLCVYSSLLFLVPVAYAYQTLPKHSTVMYGSLICFFTSFFNHYVGNSEFLRKLDIVLVNSIATYFTLRCIWKFGHQFYACIMYVLVVLSLGTYYYVNFYNPCDYHFLVHVLANTGILFYIKAVQKYEMPKNEMPKNEMPKNEMPKNEVHSPSKDQINNIGEIVNIKNILK